VKRALSGKNDLKVCVMAVLNQMTKYVIYADKTCENVSIHRCIISSRQLWRCNHCNSLFGAIWRRSYHPTLWDGSNDFENLQTLCETCHTIKSGNETADRGRVLSAKSLIQTNLYVKNVGCSDHCSDVCVKRVNTVFGYQHEGSSPQPLKHQ
jgi:hypothetical protein